MNKILKDTAWWFNASLCWLLIIIEMITLLISSIVVILLSPFLAFVSANGYKLQNLTSDSWWKLYKHALIMFCTDKLPIVLYYENLFD